MFNVIQSTDSNQQLTNKVKTVCSNISLASFSSYGLMATTDLESL